MNHRQASRDTWATQLPRATVEEINTGSLQRIADATELMARRHTELIDECERMRRMWRNERDLRKYLERRIASLRGYITRLKRQQDGGEE